MMLEDEIIEALRPLVQGHVTNAQDLLVHPHTRPQGDHKKDLPALVYSLTTLDCAENDTMCGPTLLAIDVQVECYCDWEPSSPIYGYKGARQLAFEANYALRQIGLPDNPERAGRLISMRPFPTDGEKLYRWVIDHQFRRSLYEIDLELGIVGELSIRQRNAQARRAQPVSQ
jgi:hypothetical protein